MSHVRVCWGHVPLGTLSGHLGAILGHFGAMLGQCLAMLRHVVAMLELCSSQVGLWFQLAACIPCFLLLFFLGLTRSLLTHPPTQSPGVGGYFYFSLQDTTAAQQAFDASGRLPAADTSATARSLCRCVDQFNAVFWQHAFVGLKKIDRAFKIRARCGMPCISIFFQLATLFGRRISDNTRCISRRNQTTHFKGHSHFGFDKGIWTLNCGFAVAIIHVLCFPMQSPGLESLDQRAVRQDAVQICPQSIEIASFSCKSLNEKTKRRKTLKCSRFWMHWSCFSMHFCLSEVIPAIAGSL